MAKLTPLTPPAPVDEAAVDTLARTLWGEARSEGRPGMEAVAAVVMNRVAVARAAGGRYWWGADVAGVCRAPWQFSCWNAGDPNLPKLRAVTAADPAFAAALAIARRAVAGALPDPTGGATHYHTTAISPSWARGAVPTARIGAHVFYRVD
jgi:N-acetylmuramoyl-L-alanine amidase